MNNPCPQAHGLEKRCCFAFQHTLTLFPFHCIASVLIVNHVCGAKCVSFLLTAKHISGRVYIDDQNHIVLYKFISKLPVKCIPWLEKKTQGWPVMQCNKKKTKTCVLDQRSPNCSPGAKPEHFLSGPWQVVGLAHSNLLNFLVLTFFKRLDLNRFRSNCLHVLFPHFLCCIFFKKYILTYLPPKVLCKDYHTYPCISWSHG